MLFVNAIKIYQFKAKGSKIKDYTLCLGNISKDFTINNMKKSKIKRKCEIFLVDFNSIDTYDIFDIQKYLMKKHNIREYFKVLKDVHCIIN